MRWCHSGAASLLLSTNDKTIKLWKVLHAHSITCACLRFELLHSRYVSQTPRYFALSTTMVPLQVYEKKVVSLTDFNVTDPDSLTASQWSTTAG